MEMKGDKNDLTNIAHFMRLDDENPSLARD